jgi:hypothetical protein
MRRNLVVLAAVIAIGACTSTPIPTARPSSSPAPVPLITPPLPRASPTATPAPAPTATPTPAPTATSITELVGRLTVTHPVAWRVVPGPDPIAGRPVPLFYLSDVRLTVGPCPTPNPKSGVFHACPEPLAELPSGGVLVTVVPNLGLPAMNPPQVSVGAATAQCRAIRGDAEMASVVGGTVLTACLRGPGLAAHEAEVRAVVASLGPAS